MPVPQSSRLAALATEAGARLLQVRWLVRAPIWLYRARLGIVFGSRLLMLEHIGRKTGARRYVVLEVIGHPAAGRYVVTSGFGARSQWFRNIEASPHVRVYVRSRPPAAATAHRLPSEQAASTLAAYSAHHARAWAALKPILETTLGTRITDHPADVPLVALDLTSR